ILTLYTPDHGKLHAIAKGVRRASSRRAGHLDLFSRVSVLVHQGRNLGVLSQAELVEHFPGLRTDLAASGLAHYVCELTDSFVPDGLANAKLYGQLAAVVRRLALDPSIILVRAFELALLDASGYRPELHHCVGCGQPITPGANVFSASLGGVLCPQCQTGDPSAPPISDGALKLMRNLQTSPAEVLKLESVDIRLIQETEARLQEYITYRLERRPRSVSVLQRVERTLHANTGVGAQSSPSEP